MDWEIEFLDFIQSFSNNIFDNIMIFISSLCNGGAIWIIIAVLFIYIKKYRYIGVKCTLSLIIMQITGNMVLKNIINRTRPYIANNINILISSPHGSSFPSGHTFSSFAVATAIFICDKKMGICAYALAALIGFSRLYLYVHYPTDVVGGAVLGVAVGLIACFAVDKILFQYMIKKS